jgi:hypothetical protein
MAIGESPSRVARGSEKLPLMDSFETDLCVVQYPPRASRRSEISFPDLTTAVLTLTITGIGADSSLANGNNRRLARRVAAVVAMFVGAALGAVIMSYYISVAPVACDRNLRSVAASVGHLGVGVH